MGKLRFLAESTLWRRDVEPWRDPFTWGETAAVGTVDGAAACFAWLQRGTPEGFPTYYNRIFGGEARILRVGVVPC